MHAAALERDLSDGRAGDGPDPRRRLGRELRQLADLYGATALERRAAFGEADSLFEVGSADQRVAAELRVARCFADLARVNTGFPSSTTWSEIPRNHEVQADV